MSDLAGAPNGGNGENESGVNEGEVSVDGVPDPQCKHRFGLVGDDGPEFEDLESAI